MMTLTRSGATLPPRGAGRKDRQMTEQAPARTRSAGTETRTAKWAVSVAFFAAIVMFIAGTAQFFAGLSAVLGNVPYAFTTDNQLLNFSLTTWGWIHLLVGLVVLAAGVMLLTGQRWARVVGILFALFSAITNFLYIPQYPFWTLTLVGLDILIIWALTAHGRDMAL
jgi:hypothetical protein